jgi:colanic acid biosynthesis glycosyl transferase WcaI
MRILILSQVYWPDTASTAQHLADLGRELTSQGHEVSVLASRHAYEHPATCYAAEEEHAGVKIRRLRHTGLGKGAIWKRLCDFGTFNLALLWKLVWMPRGAAEVVLGMTSPPLVSFLGALVGRWKGWKFCYWAMDLQPELAIEAGMVKRGSLGARGLEFMGNSVFKRADRIVALDRFMGQHVATRGAASTAVEVLPVWPVMAEVWDGLRLENPFRIAQGFGEKFVVMYSGNHAVVHPLDTLLQAAVLLREDDRFLFVFIGGGVRTRDVTAVKKQHELTNILQLPYQPRESIHWSLGSADLHVVIMGDGQVGYTHPNKVYGAMFIGRPFVYIGPSPSHVTDLMQACPGNLSAAHRDASGLASALQSFYNQGPTAWRQVGAGNKAYADANLNPTTLIPRMAKLVSGTGTAADAE